MSFGDAVASCFRRYATFSGRARRSEYWWWVLFTFLSSLVAAIIDAAAGLLDEDGTGPVSSLVILALLLPGIAVTVRRLHDTGRSGWFVLIGLIPVVGSIVLLVLALLDSQRFTNPYGPSPKHTRPAHGIPAH